MLGHFWHQFLTQALSHGCLGFAGSFLTIFLLVKILQQPIRIFEISASWSYHGEENASYHVKEHKKLGQKLVSKMTLHFVWGHLSKKQSVLRNTNADFFLEIKVNQIKGRVDRHTTIELYSRSIHNRWKCLDRDMPASPVAPAILTSPIPRIEDKL